MGQRASNQTGLTLIELMIAVVIVGLLIAVAVPQYKNYLLKAKIGNALTAADALKVTVGLCVTEAGTASGCSGGSKGIPADVTAGNGTAEVSTISATDGVIVLALTSGLGNGIGGKKICWGPTIMGGQVLWNASTNISASDLPAVVATITRGNTGTGPACS